MPIAGPCAIFIMAATLVAAEPSDREFQQVAAIFQAHCLSCHRGATPDGGLSFESAEQAFTGESGPAIVPGKPHESLLVEYISGDKPYMPKDKPPLSPKQVETIRHWIEKGAHWPENVRLRADASDDLQWWSLQPIRKSPVPKLDSPWIRTAVDAFILQRLHEENLRPSPPVDRVTLLRRLMFDLHGLPPTPEQVQRFLADDRPDAYERLVDELLASPRYGERWGRHWLDIVHYGDTHGYDKDKRRPNAWPYRDYVIAAFNNDTPYGRFVSEQLAGDVLFPNTPDGIVATGFIAAGPWDYVGHVELREGTVDKRITRVLDRDDMVTNALSTFASTTVHCARCHNHKFDPITQEDYYNLQAVFAGVERADRLFDPDPVVRKRRAELQAKQSQLQQAIQNVQKSVDEQTPQTVKQLDQELASLRLRLNHVMTLMRGSMEASPTNGYHSDIERTPEHVKWVQVDLGQPRALDEVILIPARPIDFPDTPGFGFPVRFFVETAADADFTQPTCILDCRQADYPNPGAEAVRIPCNGTVARYVRVTATRLWERRNDYCFALGEMQVVSDGRNEAFATNVTAKDSIETGRWSTQHLVDGFDSRNRLTDPKDPALVKQKAMLDHTRLEIEKHRNDQIAAAVDPTLLNKLHSLQAQHRSVEQALLTLPEPSRVYAAANQFSPQGQFTPAPEGVRRVYVLKRGSVEQPGDEAVPGALGCLAHLAHHFDDLEGKPESHRRAALARWLTDPDNPLTWRSIVNRVWQYHFGTGIVDTPNDFGRMGSQPSHPQLLDWLAAEFRDSEQSLKQLHRLIVCSSTYRQQSTVRSDAQKIDSANRLVWRMNRRKLDAESIRDAILAISGSLDFKMGGPGYDLFAFQDDHSPHYYYDRHDVEDPATLRRTVYRFIVRSVPDPLMECLDCADPSTQVAVRNETLTALQALSLLNNPLLISQSQRFAKRLQTSRSTLPDQIDEAFLLTFSRPIREEERTPVLQYAQEHGLENLCRLLFNSNEFLFID